MDYDDGYGYGSGSGEAGSAIDFDDPEDPSNVIHACKDDMLALWHDPTVRQVLHVGNVRLEEMPGL
jgi:guanine nucleotide-binding protein alpha-1 subunit